MTKEERLEWLALPQTREWLEYLQALREELKEAWAEGDFEEASPHEEVKLCSKVLGRLALLKEITEEIQHGF